MRPDLPLLYYTIGGIVLGLLIGFFVAMWLSFTFVESGALTVLCAICGGLVGFRLWQGH